MSGTPPVWLRRMAPKGNRYGYAAHRCACGEWVFETRDRSQYEDWNSLLLTGDEVVTALLCRRTLLRVKRTWSEPVVSVVWCGRGLCPDGWYAEAHECGIPLLGTVQYESLPHEREQCFDFLPASALCGGEEPWASNLIGKEKP